MRLQSDTPRIRPSLEPKQTSGSANRDAYPAERSCRTYPAFSRPKSRHLSLGYVSPCPAARVRITPAMAAEDLRHLGRTVSEELSAFADVAMGGQPSSQTAKKLVFVIDEATKILESLRRRLTDQPGPEEVSLELEPASRS